MDDRTLKIIAARLESMVEIMRESKELLEAALMQAKPTAMPKHQSLKKSGPMAGKKVVEEE